MNQPGQEYPQINSQGYARFRIVAPQAQSVRVSLGGRERGGFSLDKGEDGVSPRDISFKGTLQTLVAFAAAGWACPARRNELYAAVLRAVATHRVNNRPDRVEPRAVKRRKKQVYLTEPRAVAKAQLLYVT